MPTEKSPENEQCRAATVDDLKQLIKSLNDNNVEYLLIGGYALFAHGYERATTDIDIIVPANAEVGQKVKQALMVLPEKVAIDIDPAWFIQSDDEDFGTIRVADEITVDVMFNAAGETYETLREHAQTIDLEGLPINTIDLAGLLKTKQTAREKDISDRQIIERALQAIKAEKTKKIDFGPSR